MLVNTNKNEEYKTMKKRILTIMLAGVLAASALVGCQNTAQTDVTVDVVEEQTTEQASSEESVTEIISEEVAAAESVTESFVLEYPADLQQLGFTEPIVLDKAPERVVALSAAPVLALYELGVNMVGVPNSSVVTWPEDLKNNAATVSFSVMSAQDFDYEAVVALEPDLVLLGYNGAETAGATLESLGIPVYYLSAGHTVSYESIKMMTDALIDAFAVDEEKKAAGEAIKERFVALEERMERSKEAFAGKTVMVLQSGGDAHYIQTAGGTLGSMAAMIGLENVFINEGSSMVQLDFEQALEYEPDVLMCVGAVSAEEHKVAMEAAYAKNEAYWNSIEAVKNGDVIYLPVTYCSTAGINVIDNINALMDTVAEFYGVELN